MELRISRVVGAGLLGAVVMSLVGLYGAPLMGIPAMNPADMLAAKMGGITALGWMGHLMIGVVLALGYAKIFFARLPGPPVVRGVVFSLAPWLMAQLLVIPMMGMPFFSGSLPLALGSLVGHLMYGAVLGGVAGSAPQPA